MGQVCSSQLWSKLFLQFGKLHVAQELNNSMVLPSQATEAGTLIEQMFTEQFLLLTITMSLSLLVRVREERTAETAEVHALPRPCWPDFMLSLLVGGSDEQAG